VRTVARKVADWINRLGDVWVEGQVTQISNRPGTGTAFITLRDPAADVSMTVTCPTGMLREH
jgi:exodeoxyribonuclease VII large subunit